MKEGKARIWNGPGTWSQSTNADPKVSREAPSGGRGKDTAASETHKSPGNSLTSRFLKPNPRSLNLGSGLQSKKLNF